MEETPDFIPPNFEPPPSLWRRILDYIQMHREGALIGFVVGAILVALGVEWSQVSSSPPPSAGAPLQLSESETGAAPLDELDEVGRTLPEPSSSALGVYSIPTGAQVIVGTDTVGTTPLWLDALGSGEHTLTLLAEGYAPLDTVVAVDMEQRGALVLILSEGESYGRVNPSSPPSHSPPSSGRTQTTPAPSPSPASPAPPSSRTGTLAVLVRPWGTVKIDGRIHAREMDVQYVTELPVGEHQVRVEHPTLGSREASVRIRPGRTAELTFDLNPGEPAASVD